MTDIQLNDDQASAILMEGMARGLYESLNNTLPPDSTQRMKDATELVSIAKNAFNNGNRSDNVQTILFMAEVDQKPDIKQEEIAEAAAETVPDSSIHNGIDLSTLSDGVIEGLIVGLDKYPQSEQVEEDRKAYLAEKERRNEKGSQIQDDSQGTTAQAAPEKAGEAAPEGAHSQPVVDDQVSPEAGTDGGSGEIPELSAAQGDNAGAFARAQTPETSPEGKQAKAKPVEEDGKRSALEEQLTLPIVKAHTADITKLGSLPIAQIEFMLENPDGPPTEEKDMAVSESEIEASVVPKDEKVVAGIAADVPVEEKVITKADLGLEVDETTGEISADGLDRENLEAQVTGPCLKAYGRGRKEIPNIGINELKFMIDNPDGKVDPSDLEIAKNLDGPIVVDNLEDAEKLVGQENKEIEDNEAEIKVIKESEELEKDRTLTTAAFEAVAKLDSTSDDEKLQAVEKIQDAEETVIKSPPVEEASSKMNLNKWSDVKSRNLGEAVIDKYPTEIGINAPEQQQNRAMEIISRENFPIPPAYSDEEAPVFPMDMSLCSRDELFSLHAKYHAYEMRINFILCEHEDKVSDFAQLKNYREAVVAKSIPFMGEDGKRNTNEYRDAQVRGDKEVLIYGEKEHEAKKIVIDLKVHQKNYHLSCERLSRQLSKYEREIADAPR